MMRGVPTAMFDPDNGSFAAVKNPTISPGLGSSASHGSWCLARLQHHVRGRGPQSSESIPEKEIFSLAGVN